MPSEGRRRGIVENAGGSLVCPLCREPLTLGWTVVATETCRSWISHTGRGDLRIEPAAGMKLGNQGVVVLHMDCPKQHHTDLIVMQEGGLVTVETEWHDKLEEPGDE